MDESSEISPGTPDPQVSSNTKKFKGRVERRGYMTQGQIDELKAMLMKKKNQTPVAILGSRG